MVDADRRGQEPVERLVRSDNAGENLWSVSKTFLFVALGIAEAEGRLSTVNPALAHIRGAEGNHRPGPGAGHAPPTVFTTTSRSLHSWLADDPVEFSPTWLRIF